MVWLSLAVSVALVVAGAPVVELVSPVATVVVPVALVVAGALVVELVVTVAAVAVPVRVAVVSPPPQPGLDPFPMASVVSQVSRVVFCLLRGLYHPALGLALAQEHCLALDLAPLSMELPPGSPSVESCLAPPAAEFGLDHLSVASRSVHQTQLPLCFSSPSWDSVAWGLSWVLGSSPALPSWVSSWVVAPWIHLLPHQVLVLGTSSVMPLGLPVCLDPPLAL